MKTLKIFLGFAIFFFLAIFLPDSVEAATLSVPSQYSTIGSAISAASSGDTILVSSGTYNERLNVRKYVEIKSVLGSASTIIDGGQGGSTVFIANTKYNGSVPKISGFTIRNGKAPEGQGGGVTIINSDAIVENCTITSNSSDSDAGGILVHQGSNATIRNNIISSNTAKRFGGGIDVVDNSNPLIYGNTISNNIVSGPAYGTGLGKWGASGGGIYVDGNASPQIINNVIFNNSADFSGAGISLRLGNNSIVEDNEIYGNISTTGSGIHIETEGGAPTIRNNNIYNNDALTTAIFPDSGFGGGISIYNNSKPQISENDIYDNFATKGGGAVVNSENANSVIMNNKIHNNETKSDSGEYAGGAIYVADSTSIIKNNIIYKNKARLGGGIGLLDNANVKIINNTIVGNYAPFDATRKSGGGIFVKSSVISASIFNNIITQNQDYQIVEWVKKANINNNLINNNDLGIYFSDNTLSINNINDLNSNINVNADANISGSEGFINQNIENYDISQNSVAIDSGSTADAPFYDMDFQVRSNIDIGAFEYVSNKKILSPMYRFWSDLYQKHFYTIEASERNNVLSLYPVNTWKYERVAYRTYKNANCNGNSVYRFWSDKLGGHFYTISESEKDYVKSNYPVEVWKYEGPVFCGESSSINNSIALYRFWSDAKQGHFYTADAGEKVYVEDNYPDDIWKYERIGYYVYPVN